MNSRSLPLVIAALLAATTPAHAVQIGAEPFVIDASGYTAGTTNLIGQAPTTPGFAGAWLPAYSGAQSPDVLDTGLDYTGFSASGGGVSYTAGGNGRTGRLLGSPYTATSTGPLFISVLIQLESIDPGYRAFELHRGGFDDGGNRKLQVAVGESAGGLVADTDFALRANNTDSTGVSLGAIDTAVNLFILRIDFSDTQGGDTITAYRNPTDLTVETNNAPTATITGIDFEFDRASFARFNGNTGIAFDELRIGTGYNDVTGTVNPDMDGDGMDDGWEFINMVDDPDEDAAHDNDGLTNLEEFLAGTNPNKADTDDDGIDDKPELEGTLNPFDNERTDPLNPDSDGDSLTDGAEIGSANGFVTNPNVTDTDLDGEPDDIEIAEGTDPTDAGSNSAALGNFLIDGVRDSLYPAPLAVQTVETGFGDNQNELNAAYATVDRGNLYLLLTGNIQDNFNKLEIFIDSRTGGSETFSSAGNDNAGAMDGLVFDAGFAPDYHLIVRRGDNKFDLDFADLQAGQFALYSDVFAGGTTGRTVLVSPTTSTLDSAPTSINIGYNDSNTAGVGGVTGAGADPSAAAAVTTGVELCISLADLGAITDELRVSAFINSSEHDSASNQFLGGLPSGTDNLGAPNGIDLTALDGDQFFAVPLPVAAGRIISLTYDRATGDYVLTFSSNETNDYLIECSTDLRGPWNEIQDAYPPDDGDSTVYRDTEPAPLPMRKFYRVTPVEQQ